MENKNEKIVLVIDIAHEDIISFIGSSLCLKEGLKKYGYSSKQYDTLSDKIETIIKEGNEGKFILDNAIVFIIPASFTRLHTQQCSLVVLKEMENIIDIDEWWYTPFKRLINTSSFCEYTMDNKDWVRTEYGEEKVAESYLIRFKPNEHDSEWLYAIKSRNITFNLV